MSTDIEVSITCHTVLFYVVRGAGVFTTIHYPPGQDACHSTSGNITFSGPIEGCTPGSYDHQTGIGTVFCEDSVPQGPYYLVFFEPYASYEGYTSQIYGIFYAPVPKPPPGPNPQPCLST